MRITKEVKLNFIRWLNPEGVSHLKSIKEKHGELAAVWVNGRLPHSVHFSEGVQIRNWMRIQPEFQEKDQHWLDDNWVEFTERCLEI